MDFSGRRMSLKRASLAIMSAYCLLSPVCPPAFRNSAFVSIIRLGVKRAKLCGRRNNRWNFYLKVLFGAGRAALHRKPELSAGQASGESMADDRYAGSDGRPAFAKYDQAVLCPALIVHAGLMAVA